MHFLFFLSTLFNQIINIFLILVGAAILNVKKTPSKQVLQVDILWLSD
jgi:hypothetical protein